MRIPWETLNTGDILQLKGGSKIYYIYCYTNKINNHKYVGQTNNFERRVREHRSCAFNQKASSYNDLIHKKIRQYGEENFRIEVLEKLYTSDVEVANEREIYWIEKMNSHCSTGEGYNVEWGGSNRNHSSKLTKEQIEEIKIKIKNGIPFLDIQKEYNISVSFVSAINHGVYFYNEKEDYPLFKYYKEDKDYDELIDLLLNSTYSLSKIAKMLDMGYSSVKKINAGTLRHGLYPTYPIREKTAYEIRADMIKDELLHGNLDVYQIADLLNCSVTTVYRVNNGESFKDDNLSYPLTNL